MKALLKNGQWVGIDTAALYHDQYNTVEGKRIFDREIVKIEDDTRIGLGRCKYCGTLVKRGEEEKHYQEREKIGCLKCFYNRERVISRESSTSSTTENGERKTVRTTVEKLEKVCTYNDGDSSCKKADCTFKECREYGIDWFTPENTFFLKYPGGFDSILEIDKLESRGFTVFSYYARYNHKIGTYILEAIFEDRGENEKGIAYYHLYNCRRAFNFRYQDGELFTDKYAFTWKQVKTLEGVPADVMKAVKAICNH